MTILLTLKSDVTIDRKKKGQLKISSPSTSKNLVLNTQSTKFVNILENLQKKKLKEESCFKSASQEELPRLYYFLEMLKKHAFLSYIVVDEQNPLITVFPTSKPFHFTQAVLSAIKRFKLSKFALVRQNEEEFFLETPLFSGHILIHEPKVLAYLHAFAKPKCLKDFPKTPYLETLISLLYSAKILCPEDHEEQDPLSQQWEFHDLLLHTRSRMGRHANPYGGLFPFKGKIPPLPSCKPPAFSSGISLFRPNLEQLKDQDPSLTQVIEGRRSKREHGKKPITLKQLGEFLFRSARVIEIVSSKESGETSRRPYPGGGAIYELELYPLISSCTGLKKGLYHYNAKDHELYLLKTPSVYLEELVHDAMRASGKKEAPQVLIVIAARFQRLSWKYRSMAYAITLKNTGVLLQTMYLVATAMKLAPCALGGGNSDVFSEAIQSNYLEETSVGEFMLGRG
jgi:SagB-type dehydrogenase family enzyme